MNQNIVAERNSMLDELLNKFQAVLIRNEEAMANIMAVFVPKKEGESDG